MRSVSNQKSWWWSEAIHSIRLSTAQWADYSLQTKTSFWYSRGFCDTVAVISRATSRHALWIFLGSKAFQSVSGWIFQPDCVESFTSRTQTPSKHQTLCYRQFTTIFFEQKTVDHQFSFRCWSSKVFFSKNVFAGSMHIQKEDLKFRESLHARIIGHDDDF